jgi:hypothetical protein
MVALPDHATDHAFDHLAARAATLLAKAMVVSEDQERLWEEFIERVLRETRRLEDVTPTRR